MPRADGPFKVIEEINDNAYKLPADFAMVSPTFNIVDLKPYFGEEDEIESRTTSIQDGEHDEEIPSIDTSAAPTANTYKDLSLELVPSNLTIRYLRFVEHFLTYMRI
jgi:hypothetical protein